jgi:hypothetical protein
VTVSSPSRTPILPGRALKREDQRNVGLRVGAALRRCPRSPFSGSAVVLPADGPPSFPPESLPDHPRKPIDEYRGEPDGGGRPLSCLLAGRQAQSRQEQLAVLGVSQIAGVWHHDGGDGAQARDDISRLAELSHMGVAGGEKAMSPRVAWVLLDREE